MLARICEGRASPFVFSCCDSMGVDVGTCTLDVGCLEEQDWTRPLQQVGLFGGLDLSFRPCRRGAGGLGKIVARFAARFPLHFLRSHLSGCEERGSIGDDDCCLFPLPFRGQRIWSWSPGFPLVSHGLTLSTLKGTKTYRTWNWKKARCGREERARKRPQLPETSPLSTKVFQR